LKVTDQKSSILIRTKISQNQNIYEIISKLGLVVRVKC